MHDAQTVDKALQLLATGLSLSEVARRTGVSRATLREWSRGPRKEKPRPPCPAEDPTCLPQDTYAYLLGLYLGDGSISSHAKGVYRMRIACANVYPGLIELAKDALGEVMPNNKVGVVQSIGCVDVNSYSKHWPCLFPQHGKGMKHTRKIELALWQLEIAREWPIELIRGLIHSDGCRDLNPVNGSDYVRYSFCNTSEDILKIFTDALDLVGVHWTRANKKIISIARRPSVAMMEMMVGAKY